MNHLSLNRDESERLATNTSHQLLLIFLHLSKMATEERLITKNVLYAGEGDVPEFENGSKVKTFHSIARL